IAAWQMGSTARALPGSGLLADDGRQDTAELVRAYETLKGEHEAHRAAVEAKARLAAIVENSDDAIVGKTLEGIITTWNQGAERIFGYTAEEMIGESIYKIFPPERRHEEPMILAKMQQGEIISHFETQR